MSLSLQQHEGHEEKTVMLPVPSAFALFVLFVSNNGITHGTAAERI
jgi:hypothetical protein